MHLVVLLIVLIVIVFLLYKSVQDARQRAGESGGPRPLPRRPPPMRRPGPRSRKSKPRPKLDEQALAQHVAQLRTAVGSGLISSEEAVASILRQTDGAVTEDAARKLLRENGVA